jgi:hypothetical protein
VRAQSNKEVLWFWLGIGLCGFLLMGGCGMGIYLVQLGDVKLIEARHKALSTVEKGQP